MWKLAAIGVCYVALYLIFGYFVAWQNPALRDYYGGTAPSGNPRTVTATTLRPSGSAPGTDDMEGGR